MKNCEMRTLIREIKKAMEDAEMSIIYTEIGHMEGVANLSDKNRKTVVANLEKAKVELTSKMSLLLAEIEDAINKMS